ncbi:MAG: hypothetical protein EAX91_02085 [Candidatus Lokiarchaeota archaeon]|nr:hypothetical protein [Candidatus Lokiarchaeota archaeon]
MITLNLNTRELIKINRSKIVKNITLLATIGILLLVFSTSVQGWGGYRSRINIRPIEDWKGEDVVGWADPESGLVIHPQAVEWVPADPESPNFPFTLLDWERKPIWECEYWGTILERELDDQNTLISIYIYVKEVPFMIFTLTGADYIYYPPLYYGVMQYYFQCKMQFNTESLYNIFEADGKIPALNEIFGASYGFWPYPEEPVPLVTYMHILGVGEITEGGDGTVYLHQLGIFNTEIGDYDYPYETVVVK